VQVIPMVPHGSHRPYNIDRHDSGLGQMPASGSIMGPKPGNLHGPDQSSLVISTYVVSGMNILIDWSVAIVPVIILWDVQIHRTLKIMANLVTGIGAL
jgi:hypothetical protein